MAAARPRLDGTPSLRVEGGPARGGESDDVGLCAVAGPDWRCTDPRLVVGSVVPAAGCGLDGCGLRCLRPCPATSSLPCPSSSLRCSSPILALLLALTN
uniref:Uncharacterized protein n=1 Tax=Oryza glumipatula TaxID=40148 RepID=A0A0E0AMG3_9ORYZ